MKQPSPKADQLRAMREAKHNKRGDNDVVLNRVGRQDIDAGRSLNSGGGNAVAARPSGPKKVPAAAVKAPKGKTAKRRKKQAVRHKGSAVR